MSKDILELVDKCMKNSYDNSVPCIQKGGIKQCF